jgi:hypothetical protein
MSGYLSEAVHIQPSPSTRKVSTKIRDCCSTAVFEVSMAFYLSTLFAAQTIRGLEHLASIWFYFVDGAAQNR